MADLVESVLAAKAAVEAKYAAQINNGVPFSPAQEAEMLIAAIQAIIAPPAPAKPATPAATPAAPPAGATP